MPPQRSPRWILTADLGNTCGSFALTRGRRVLRYATWPTHGESAAAAEALRRVLGESQGPRIHACVLSSVVPERSRRVATLVSRALGAPPIALSGCLGSGDLTVLPQRGGVGEDRLANALGALHLLGERYPLVVVDVGTAVTVDVVTPPRRFEGGMIAPGPRLASHALHAQTSLLPHVAFGRAREPVGRTTREAIRAGLWFGCRGLVKGMVEAALRGRRGARIVVAGGLGRACLEGSGLHCVFAPHLTHVGLAVAFDRWEVRSR